MVVSASRAGQKTRFLKANHGANSLLLASFLMEKGVRNRLQFCIPLISDNQGNIFAMLNQSTTAILMRLVLSLHPPLM